MKIPRTLTTLSALSSRLTTPRIPSLGSNAKILDDLTVNRTTQNEDPTGFTFCQRYYGEPIDRLHLSEAFDQLPEGEEEILYHVNEPHERYHLPLIQVVGKL